MNFGAERKKEKREGFRMQWSGFREVTSDE